MVDLQSVLAAIRGRRRWLLLGGVAGVVLLAGAYLMGSRYYGAAMEAYRTQQQDLLTAQSEVAQLRQDLVNREVGDKVDGASLEQLRQQVAGLQSALALQESELNLYRNLLDEYDEPSGLHVDGLTLRRAPGLDSFQYRIVVRRRANLNESADVSVSLSIDGQRQGEPASIPFNEADLSMQGDGLSIRFRYFKVLRGTFVLPADFVPSKVVLSVLEKNDPSSLRIVEFPWQVTES